MSRFILVRKFVFPICEKFSIAFYFSLSSFCFNAYAEPTKIDSTDGAYLMYSQSKALIIGMSKYKHWEPLHTVPSDVESVRQALLRQGFKESDISVEKDLVGSQLQNRVRSFLVQDVKRDTRLVLYFAGHGWTDGQFTGYLVPADNALEGERGFRDYLLSMSAIGIWSQESLAKHILLVFDSCFSGAVFLTRSNLRPNELFLKDADRPVRQYITSGSATEAVPAQSDFVKKFVEGLDGAADIYKDGIITGNQLGYWLKREVTKLGKQTPQYGTSPLQLYSRGDVLFQTSANAASSTKKIPVYSNSKAKRGAESIGLPDDNSLSYFKGVNVFYYQKIADGNAIKDALDARRIPFVKTRASLPQSLPTNSIACSPDVPIQAIRTLALALHDGGVPIRDISKFRNPSAKPMRLEVLTWAQFDSDGSAREISQPPISRSRLAEWPSCA